MTRLSIPAWRNGSYVSLAELLLVLGRFVHGFQWRLCVYEAAPGPGASTLETWDPQVSLSTYGLLHLLTPDVQLIDGYVSTIETRPGGQPLVTLRAIDSSSWDIETWDPGIAEAITDQYAEATVEQ